MAVVTSNEYSEMLNRAKAGGFAGSPRRFGRFFLLSIRERKPVSGFPKGLRRGDDARFFAQNPRNQSHMSIKV